MVYGGSQEGTDDAGDIIPPMVNGVGEDVSQLTFDDIQGAADDNNNEGAEAEDDGDKTVKTKKTNEAFRDAVEVELSRDTNNGTDDAEHFVVGQFDPYTPFFMTVGNAFGLRGLPVARRVTCNDIVLAGSRHGEITEGKGAKVAPIAKNIATLRATGTVNADYLAINNRQPLWESLNQVEETSQAVAENEEEIARIHSLPRTVAARAAAGKIGKALANVARTSRECKCENAVVSGIVVGVKVLLQITFNEWERRCGRDCPGLFQNFRRLGRRIYGASIGSLTLDLVLQKVVVEASHQELSDEERETVIRLLCRLKTDMSSVVFLPEW